jgi:hypothetical protein
MARIQKKLSKNPSKQRYFPLTGILWKHLALNLRGNQKLACRSRRCVCEEGILCALVSEDRMFSGGIDIKFSLGHSQGRYNLKPGMDRCLAVGKEAETCRSGSSVADSRPGCAG